MRRSTFASVLAAATTLLSSQPVFAQSTVEVRRGYPCRVRYVRINNNWQISDIISVSLYRQPHCEGSFAGSGTFDSIGTRRAGSEGFTDQELLSHFERLHESAVHGALVELTVLSANSKVLFCDFYGGN